MNDCSHVAFYEYVTTILVVIVKPTSTEAGERSSQGAVD